MNTADEHFMQRCFDLALLGAGYTAPNPMVGAVVVHRGRIIGEGYHRAYGQAHAEVNAVQSIAPQDRHLLPESTLYVSLEPCNIHRNTPPCTLLILNEGIRRVVVSCLDRTPGVNGSGLERLRNAGVEVKAGVLEEQGRRLSAMRNRFVTGQRPYLLLKYAQSANGIFSPHDNRQLWLTHNRTQRLVHKWRGVCPAIMVGANTALADNPQLTNRHYYGPSPLRVVYDREGNLPNSLKLFSDGHPTLLFLGQPAQGGYGSGVSVEQVPQRADPITYMLQRLAALQISTLMVEGGLHTLNTLLERGLWDEARVLTAAKHVPPGRPAPQLPHPPAASCSLQGDRIDVFFR